MKKWLGPADAAGRTAVGILVYWASHEVLPGVFSPGAEIIAELLSGVFGVGVSALISTRGWSVPSIRVRWAESRRDLADSGWRFDYSPTYPSKTLTATIELLPVSLLAKVLLRRAQKRTSLYLHLAFAPPGVLDCLVHYYPPGHRLEQGRHGFSIELPKLERAGVVSTLKIQLEVQGAPDFLPAQVHYSLRNEAGGQIPSRHLVQTSTDTFNFDVVRS